MKRLSGDSQVTMDEAEVLFQALQLACKQVGCPSGLESALYKAFALADQNKDGGLSAGEMNAACWWTDAVTLLVEAPNAPIRPWANCYHNP